MRTFVLFALVACQSNVETGDSEKSASVDADGDGATSVVDCDDGDPSVGPDATERCDGVDNDCDGLVDDQDDSVDASDEDPWYPDADDDGYGDANAPVVACAQPDHTVKNGEDCDDAAAEVHPNANEVCNGVDDDCDALVDDADADMSKTGLGTWFGDADADGYGDPEAEIVACAQPAGSVDDATDCDDTDGAVNPAAVEVCNGYDDDCNGAYDDGDPGVDLSTGTVFFIDADEDGFGDPSVTESACEDPPYGADNADDCDDAQPTVYPGAPEVCDTLDNDCDTIVDDADRDVVGQPTWYEDGDGDGYGADETGVVTCFGAAGTIVVGADCVDDDPAINPGATEICDDIDNDCDTLTDNFDDSVTGQPSWYPDVDEDGFGAIVDATPSCGQPFGMVLDNTDCDDTTAAANPDAVETCDDLDNDCDALVDDADDSIDVIPAWFQDIDGDGYGDPATEIDACDTPLAFIADGTDCDDADIARNPGAAEVCDLIDNDCDGVADFGFNVPEDYATVQAAIDAAPDGGHVCVGAGTWPENLVVSGRSLTLEGHGAEETVIDGSLAGPVLLVESGSDLTVAGLSLENGTGSYGGGIYAYLSTLYVQDSHVQDNVCPSDSANCFGTGIYAEATQLTLDEVEVTGNAGELDGGASTQSWMGVGVYVVDGAFDATGGRIGRNTARSTTADNVVAAGVGLYVYNTPATLVGTEISENSSLVAGAGAGAWFGGDSVVLDGVSVHDNSVSNSQVLTTEAGGAGLFFQNQTATLTDCAVDYNVLSLGDGDMVPFGAGIGAYYSDVAISGGSISDNYLASVGTNCSASGGGAAITGGTVSFDGVAIDRNTLYVECTTSAYGTGAAVSVAGTALTARSSSFDDNTSIVTATGYAYGDGVVYAQADATLADVSISGNSQTVESSTRYAFGDGTLIVYGDSLDVTGLTLEENVSLIEAPQYAYVYPGIAVFVTDLSVADSSLSYNTGSASSAGFAAAQGGGFEGYANNASFVGVDAVGNVLEGEDAIGGGLAVYGDVVTLSQVNVSGNTLLGAFVAGGGVAAQVTDMTVENTILAGNAGSASGTGEDAAVGGGLWAAVTGSLSLSQVDVAYNTLEGGSTSGGGVYLQSSSAIVSVSASNLVGNEAGTGAAMTASASPTVSYTNAYGNVGTAFSGFSDPTGTDGNISGDPGYTDTSGADPATWDLHLGGASVCIDAGDPASFDPDGSVADIGAYGGAGGAW